MASLAFVGGSVVGAFVCGVVVTKVVLDVEWRLQQRKVRHRQMRVGRVDSSVIRRIRTRA